MKSVPWLVLLGTLAAGGCAGQKAPEAPPPPKELNVYIWTNYHSPEAIARFEKDHGVRVVIDTYDNNEVIEQKLQSGTAPYDIVVPSDYMVVSLARQGLLTPLDEARLPGLANLDPLLDWGKALGGPRYSVPYLWGTTGFAYRADKIPEPIDSWAPFFDPKYKGRIVMLDDMREDFAVALKSLGHSLNTTDEAQLRAAQKMLADQRPLVLAYDSSDFAGKVQAGDGWLVHGYSGELATVARDSGGTIKYVLPKEGATIAVDNLAIPTAAKHVDLAYAFIAFMLQPDVAADTTNVTGYPTANAAAKPTIKAEIVGDPAVFPSAEALGRCELMK